MSGYYDRDKAAGTVTRYMHQPKAYIGNTSEYMVAGWPYVKSILNDDGNATDYTLTLRYVTSEIKIQAVGGDMTISLQGSSDTFVVAAGTTMTLPVKCTTLSFSNAVQGNGITVIASLTNIRAAEYPSDAWEGGSVTEVET